MKKLIQDLEWELTDCVTDYYHPGRVDSNDLTEMKKELLEFMIRICRKMED